MEEASQNSYLDDKELADGIRAKNEAAYHALAQQLTHRFMAPVTRRTRSPEDAEEILNDAAFKIITQIGSFKPQGKESFWGWVWRIVENRSIDEHRRRKRMEPERPTSLERLGPFQAVASEVAPWLTDTVVEVVSDPLVRIAHVALSQLQERDRVILELYYLADLSDKEVATRIATREDNVRKYRSRAVKRLESILEGHPEFRDWQQSGVHNLETARKQ